MRYLITGLPRAALYALLAVLLVALAGTLKMYVDATAPLRQLTRIDLAHYTAAAQPEDELLAARVDEALSTMREGSDRDKLRQIAEYLARRITYRRDQPDPLPALDGHGNCAAYAELFRCMAARLGIEAQVVHGYAGGGYHAWNMVVVDGKQYFYDVCWFDGEMIWNYAYLHSADSWGREYKVIK